MKRHYSAPQSFLLLLNPSAMLAASPALPVDPSKTTDVQHSPRLEDLEWEDE